MEKMDTLKEQITYYDKAAELKKHKEGMLNVRLEQQHKDLLKGLAAQQKISTSAYIRQLINSFALPTE